MAQVVAEGAQWVVVEVEGPMEEVAAHVVEEAPRGAAAVEVAAAEVAEAAAGVAASFGSSFLLGRYVPVEELAGA